MRKEKEDEKTKIVCTLGPACDDEIILAKMLRAGMCVARLNFSHGTHEDHRLRLQRLRNIAKQEAVTVGVLLDTKGPEIRIRKFENDRVELRDGQKFVLTAKDIWETKTESPLPMTSCIWM